MIFGMDFVDVLERFMKDDNTDAVVMIGALGGTFEENAAEYYRSLTHKKPIIGFVAGEAIPFGHKMGYAGDIITKGRISVQDKKDAMNAAGITVVNNINAIHEKLQELAAPAV